MSDPSAFAAEQAYLLEAATYAEANPAIVDCLNGDESYLKSVSKEGVRLAGDIFNAYSTGCEILGENPRAELVKERIVPEYDRISELGGNLVHLLNSSLDRNGSIKPVIGTAYKGRRREVCHSAEEYFATALGHESDGKFIAGENEPNEVYLDKQGHPILFKKRFEASSTISFVPVTVNGITHPAGTIFGTSLREGAAAGEDSILLCRSMAAYCISNIGTIRPLRLSTFSLPVSLRYMSMLRSTQEADSPPVLSWAENYLIINDLPKYLVRRFKLDSIALELC